MASVFAGNTFFRSSFGGALPLAAPRMCQSLGIGWASSTLGFISVAMVPLPFILERVSSSHVFVLQDSGWALANCAIVRERTTTEEQVRKLDALQIFLSFFLLPLSESDNPWCAGK